LDEKQLGNQSDGKDGLEVLGKRGTTSSRTLKEKNVQIWKKRGLGEKKKRILGIRICLPEGKLRGRGKLGLGGRALATGGKVEPSKLIE